MRNIIEKLWKLFGKLKIKQELGKTHRLANDTNHSNGRKQSMVGT